MADKLNVAIVGLGFGVEFIPIYQRHPNAGNVEVQRVICVNVDGGGASRPAGDAQPGCFGGVRWVTSGYRGHSLPPAEKRVQRGRGQIEGQKNVPLVCVQPGLT